MLWASEIRNTTDLIEEWLAGSRHIAMQATARRELVARGAGRGPRPAPRDEALRLMRITGKCVFDDIFRGRRKR